MNIKLVILPDTSIDSTISKMKEVIIREFGKITNKPIEIEYDIESIKFEEESTYYLLYCYFPSKFKEINKNAHKMILLSATYPHVGRLTQDYNFGGIICYRHLVEDTPILFGLKNVIDKIEEKTTSIQLIQSEKYDTLYKPEYTTFDVLKEYLLAYDQHMRLNKNKPPQ